MKFELFQRQVRPGSGETWLRSADSPHDGGVELSCVQVDGGEGGGGETFAQTRQRGPEGLHVCGGGASPG